MCVRARGSFRLVSFSFNGASNRVSRHHGLTPRAVPVCVPLSHAKTFRHWLRKFPSLINCCYVDWFDPWPAEALRSVASRLLLHNTGMDDSAGETKGVDGEETAKSPRAVRAADLDKDALTAIVEVCVAMQTRAVSMCVEYRAQLDRHFHVTPTTYLQLVNTFKRLFALKREEVSTHQRRYRNGVAQILSTEQKVATMRQELISLQPILEQSRKDTAQLMADIEVQQQQADATREVVQAEEEECTRQAQAAQQIRDECESDLSQALPALKAATQALKTLTKSDIVVVKSMRKPPPGVKLVLETVCIVLKVKPVKNPKTGKKDFWLAAQKSLLNDTRFVKRLRTYNKDKLSAKIAAKLEPYLENPEFQPEKIAFASTAAEGMCKWVRAMVSYHHVSRDVEPKRQALAAADATLAEAQVWMLCCLASRCLPCVASPRSTLACLHMRVCCERGCACGLWMRDGVWLLQEALRVKKAHLRDVVELLDDLKHRLADAEQRKEELTLEVARCSERLDRAQQLIQGLATEKRRWAATTQTLKDKSDTLVGDVLLSSGIIAYLGAFTLAFRRAAIRSWMRKIQVRLRVCGGLRVCPLERQSQSPSCCVFAAFAPTHVGVI